MKDPIHFYGNLENTFKVWVANPPPELFQVLGGLGFMQLFWLSLWVMDITNLAHLQWLVHKKKKKRAAFELCSEEKYSNYVLTDGHYAFCQEY